jgi:hypothetical protein
MEGINLYQSNILITNTDNKQKKSIKVKTKEKVKDKKKKEKNKKVENDNDYNEKLKNQIAYIKDIHLNPPFYVFFSVGIPTTTNEKKKLKTFIGLTNLPIESIDKQCNIKKEKIGVIWKYIMIMKGFQTEEEAKACYIIWHLRTRGAESRFSMGLILYEHLCKISRNISYESTNIDKDEYLKSIK